MSQPLSELDDRDERFIVAAGRVWNDCANAILRVASYVLPRRLVLKLATFFEDTAEGVGVIIGSVHVAPLVAKNFARWLIFGG
jgi:hypothetical protein